MKLVLAVLLASGCVQRIRLETGSPSPGAPGLATSVRCETGDGVVELEGWSAAVGAALRSTRGSSLRLEGARLVCRSVVVDSRPVVSGANRPAVMMADVTELELQVELTWSTANPNTCAVERWLGRSMWRVVPTDGGLTEALATTVRAAIADAVKTAAVAHETSAPCPAGL
ncbi:MAG: hypothetical protein JNJ54_26475 [Myxococcaceae bacterium]|nr:hypothetical protein [Myxococcaceae bacterium]